VHAFAAMAAFALGAVQLAAPKGTLPHRTVGWLWVALMATVATTSFWIHDLRVWGQWSPIHLLSMFTLIMLPPADACERSWRSRIDDACGPQGRGRRRVPGARQDLTISL
jgi:uncharacterized membrane protein